MEKKWWHSSVVYQIYPRSFQDSDNDGVGDLKGIISRLDYLSNLGIDVIWLSPVYKSPMDDNGYDIADYQDIAAEFGTLEDMEELIAKAKEVGIKIVMDLVVNHTSDEHFWFKEALKGKDNPYRDYYVWRKPGKDGGVPNELGSTFGGSAWEYDEASGEYYLHLFSKRQPDLNWKNPKVQEEVHKMMNWWLDKGIGGFRMDVIDLIGKEIDEMITGDGPTLHPLLKEMNKATFGDRDVLTVGECWGATPEIAKIYSNPIGDELSMVFQFEHITMDWDQKHGKWLPREFNLADLKKIFAKWQQELENDGWNSLFWNNHDLPRVVSKRGNTGEFRVQSAKMLGTVLHMMKGTPYVFQGEEIGMTNVAFDTLEEYNDIETLNFYKEKIEEGFSHEDMMNAIYENSRDNARTPVQWNDSKNAGFTEGQPWLQVNPNYTKINVENALEDQDSIFYHYKKLIQLRKDNEVIVYGDFKLLVEDHPTIFAYTRELDGDKILVVANFGEEEVVFSPEVELEAKEMLISNYKDSSMDLKEKTLRPYEAIAYRLV